MPRTFRRTRGWSPADRDDGGSSILGVIGAVFSVIGLGLVVATVVLTARTRAFLQRATSARGEVVALSRQVDHHVEGDRILFRPLVRFRSAAGQTIEFLSTTATAPPAYTAGDPVDILYDPARPQSASIRSFFDLWGVSLILGGLGSVFSLIGLGLLVLWTRERLARARRAQTRVERSSLADFGQKVVATIREVRAEPDDTYRIIAQWLDPGNRSIYVFESEPLGYDPTAYLGETIPVFVNANNPSEYLVDLSGLPTLGNPD